MRLIGRSLVEEAALAAQAEGIAAQIAAERGQQRASAVLRERCEKAATAQDIEVNKQMLQEMANGHLQLF